MQWPLKNYTCLSHQIVPESPCGMPVIYITPNGEDGPNSLTVPFGDYVVDGFYGFLWHCDVQQVRHVEPWGGCDTPTDVWKEVRGDCSEAFPFPVADYGGQLPFDTEAHPVPELYGGLCGRFGPNPLGYSLNFYPWEYAGEYEI